MSDGNPAQDTTKDFKLAPHPDESGHRDSKCSSTTTHDNKMPPDGDSGVTNSGTLNDMPPDGILLAEDPNQRQVYPKHMHPSCKRTWDRSGRRADARKQQRKAKRQKRSYPHVRLVFSRKTPPLSLPVAAALDLDLVDHERSLSGDAAPPASPMVSILALDLNLVDHERSLSGDATPPASPMVSILAPLPEQLLNAQSLLALSHPPIQAPAAIALPLPPPPLPPPPTYPPDVPDWVPDPTAAAEAAMVRQAG